MTKFFNKFKKPCFGSFLVHFPQFWGQKIFFPGNSALPRTTSCRFLAPCQNLEKTNDTIPWKCPDRRKDGQTLFHRTLPTTARVSRRYKICKKWEQNTTERCDWFCCDVHTVFWFSYCLFWTPCFEHAIWFGRIEKDLETTILKIFA